MSKTFKSETDTIAPTHFRTTVLVKSNPGYLLRPFSKFGVWRLKFRKFDTRVPLKRPKPETRIFSTLIPAERPIRCHSRPLFCCDFFDDFSFSFCSFCSSCPFSGYGFSFRPEYPPESWCPPLLALPILSKIIK